MATKTISEPTILGKRLKEAREKLGLPQDKFGIKLGLDEGCSSARISRYESGVHQPPLKTIQLMAKTLNVPVAYLFCEDDLMARAILKLSALGRRKLVDVLNQIEKL